MVSERKEMLSAIEAAKRGFTLVELLVVVAILGILATMAVVGLADKPEAARIKTCESSVQAIKQACIVYDMEHNKMPKTMDDLLKENSQGVAALDGGEGAKYDPWGNEYKLEVKGKKAVIISGGPDGEIGNEDDIRSDKVKRQKKED